MKKSALFIFPLLLTSCSSNESSTQNSYISQNGWYFGTSMSVTLFDSSKEVLEHVFQIFSDYSDLTDAYYPHAGTDLKQINNIYYLNKDENEGKEIEVDSRLASLLSFGNEMRSKTCLQASETDAVYYFNPLIGNLSTLWKNFIDNKTTFPTDEKISQLLDEMNSSKLEIDGNIVKRSGKGKIDVGAYAKGYVVKIVQDYLKEQGITRYYINGGSSSLAFGSNSSGGAYKITISSIKNSGYSQAYFMAENTSVGTSGVSEQGRIYQGNTYSHIVNPNTGSGLAKFDTVCIKTDDAAVADILSTVVFIGGKELADALKDRFTFEYLLYDGENIVNSDNLNLVLEK